MGQCYTVKLKFKPKDNIGALNALLEKIDKDEHAEPPHGAHYHLEDGLTLNACVVYEHVRRNRSKRYEILIYNKEGYEIIMPKQVEIIKYLD